MKPAPVHHVSHAHLLTRVAARDAPLGRVDAVIVPAARPVSCLREAMRLARDLKVMLVALCTRSAAAVEAAELGWLEGVATVAIDVEGANDLLPRLESTRLLAREGFASSTDVSLRRNLGLLVARVAGWRGVLFLDDDISQAKAREVRAAAGLLGKYCAVGLHNHGFPDNSVVCHAYRRVGGVQDTFIGAGALMVNPIRSRSFFPKVYNEDWLFLLGDRQSGPLAVTGGVYQRPYRPFADPRRARDEEFGDCVGEGLYWLLDDRMSIGDADSTFWRDFLLRRRRFVGQILDKVRSAGPLLPDRDQVIDALEAAQGVGSYVTPKLCHDYVRAWRKDLGVWRNHVARLPVGLQIDKCLSELGLTDRSYHSDQASQNDLVIPSVAAGALR
jgi:hypothetical protein